VPVQDNQGLPIGTLCILDNKSDQKLDAEDVRFMSLMATRVNAELIREESVRERLSEQRAVVEKQQADLAATDQVLSAMNTAFGLLGDAESKDDLIAGQVRALRGVLGYEGVALLTLSDSGIYEGQCFPCQARKASRVSLSQEEANNLFRSLETRRSQTLSFAIEAGVLASLLRCPNVGVGCLWHEGRPIGLLALGRLGAPPLDNRLHAMQLEAILDQVSLLVSTHLFQDALIASNSELRSTQQGLVQSEKLSAVGTLAASTAHDIRNILSSLSLRIASAEDDPIDALGAVKEQLDRFAVLAHRLLSYARPSQILKQPTDVHQVLDRVLTLTAPQMRVHDVTVTDKRAASAPVVSADSNRLEHLFVNLVLNAVQAMSSDGGTITIATTSSTDRLTVRITDTGRGIPADAIPHLFEPFRTSRKEGFGLGLYSCKHIVEEHGGSISASRGLLRGTTFTIELPVE
jgi:signal transduction histidine kinase